MRMMWSRWWPGRRRPTAGNEGYEGKESKLICTAKEVDHRVVGGEVHRSDHSARGLTMSQSILQGALQCLNPCLQYLNPFYNGALQCLNPGSVNFVVRSITRG